MTTRAHVPRWLLVAALAPMILGADFTCEKTGNTRLYLLQIHAGGVNRLPSFDAGQREYTIMTEDATTMNVNAIPEDLGATVTWNMNPSGGYIGVGGGSVTMDVPSPSSKLFVFVKAPGGASASYEITINPICSLGGTCDDGDPCTGDVCNTPTGICEFMALPDGTPCDAGVPGPHECSAGACLATGCTNDAFCDDSNVCTVDACTIATGDCSNLVQEGAACGPGGTAPGSEPENQGACDLGGICQPNDQCAVDVDCPTVPPAPADEQCTTPSCDVAGFSNVCRFTDVADATPCTLTGGGPGLCNAGACTPCMESPTLDTDCTPAECGDGTLNVTAGEQCDDGNLVDDDGCDSSCQFGLIACGLDLTTCSAGDGCYPTLEGAYCFPAGSTPEDDACSQQNDCEAGFGCVDRLVGSIGTSQCTELCDPANGFTCSSGGPCSGLAGASGFGSCQYDPCDPLDIASCDPGLACYRTTTAGDLCFDAGTTAAGGACTSSTDCVAGTWCINDNTNDVCLVLCDPANGDADCGAGEVCNTLVGDPNLGACFTP